MKEVADIPAAAEFLLQRAESPQLKPESPPLELEFVVTHTNAKQGQIILTILYIMIIMVTYMLFILAPIMVMFLGIFGSQRPFALT